MAFLLGSYNKFSYQHLCFAVNTYGSVYTWMAAFHADPRYRLRPFRTMLVVRVIIHVDTALKFIQSTCTFFVLLLSIFFAIS